MNIRPLGKRVLIESLPSATVTPGGLHLPQGTEERSHLARVVAVGEKITEVKVGDRVVMSRFQGNEVDIHDTTMRIVEEAAILGVIPND